MFTFQEKGTACGMIQCSFSRKIYAYCMWTWLFNSYVITEL